MPTANPVFDLGSPTWVRVVAVPETPSDMTQWNNYMVGVPASATMPPLGTRGTLVVSGVPVTGYLRQVNGNYEWVMMPALDPIEALIDSLPGTTWRDTAARQTWINIGLALRGYGVSQSDLDGGLRSLWNSEKTELLKEYGVIPS